MRLWDDAELLAAYATERSEEAFATLVERHVALVYSSALRQVRDPHLAEEITQAVFIILAQKAGRLKRESILAGWLCLTARLAACNVLKAEHRRHQREQEAHMNSILNEPVPDAWSQISPLLDAAVAELSEADRNAIVLRYYQQKSLEEVGKALGLNADAAQKRVARALEKLRARFVKRGVTLTATVIAGAVAANSVQAAPMGLAAIVKAASLTAAATGTFGFFQFMTISKLKLGLNAIVVTGVIVAFVIQHQTQVKLRTGNEFLRQQMAQLQNDNESLSNSLTTIGDAKKLTDEQFMELLKLRGEVGVLRNQIAAAAPSPSDLGVHSSTNRYMADDAQSRQKLVGTWVYTSTLLLTNQTTRTKTTETAYHADGTFDMKGQFSLMNPIISIRSTNYMNINGEWVLDEIIEYPYRRQIGGSGIWRIEQGYFYSTFTNNTGVWRVESGTRTYIVTNLDNRVSYYTGPTGMETKDEIISLTGQEFTKRDRLGQVQTATRKQ